MLKKLYDPIKGWPPETKKVTVEYIKVTAKEKYIVEFIQDYESKGYEFVTITPYMMTTNAGDLVVIEYILIFRK